MRLPNRNLLGALAGIGLLSAFPLLSAQPGPEAIKMTQTLFQEWVGVEKDISAERSDWEAEKEVLLQTLELLKGEKESLEKAIADARESATASDRRREELTTEEDQLKALASTVSGILAGYEKQIKALAPKLPEPLLNTIAQPLNRIPSDPADTTQPLTTRLQNVAAILNEIDKFNTTLLVISAPQTITENGQEREAQVKTLYFGLGAAYFVDGTGTFAGYGVPTDEGWEWRVEPGIAEAVNQLLAVYDGSAVATFVPVPAQVR